MEMDNLQKAHIQHRLVGKAYRFVLRHLSVEDEDINILYLNCRLSFNRVTNLDFELKLAVCITETATETQGMLQDKVKKYQVILSFEDVDFPLKSKHLEKHSSGNQRTRIQLKPTFFKDYILDGDFAEIILNFSYYVE